MVNTYSDLQIEILEEGADNYSIEMIFVAAGSDSEVRLLKDKTKVISRKKLLALKEFIAGSEEYGEALAKLVFADPIIAVSFEKARSASHALDALLRVRLLLDSNLGDLHDVHWECLRDVSGNSVFTSDQILFSRYLPSLDWEPPKIAVGKKLKALVAIANPKDLSNYESDGETLSPIDEKQELASARKALEDVHITVLASPTVESISEALREGYDILYLVCHGAVIDGKAQLMLCDEKGNVKMVSGASLEIRFRDLGERPRLVVLASCQSARGTHSLGPMLAGAGVPAVVAMQGNLSMETNRIFMPAFFRELIQDGRIDRAMSVARGRIREQSDSWMPILYMRLRSGRIWQADEEGIVQPVAPPVLLPPVPLPPAPSPAPPPAPSRLGRYAIITLLGLAVWFIWYFFFNPYTVNLSLELQAGDGQGSPTVLSQPHPFRKSDRVSIHLESRFEGYVYVFSKSGDEPYRVLYPAEKGDSAQVSAGQKIRIPGKADKWVSLENETVSVIWSEAKIEVLDTAIDKSERDGEYYLISSPEDMNMLKAKIVASRETTSQKEDKSDKPLKLHSDWPTIGYSFKLEVEE